MIHLPHKDIYLETILNFFQHSTIYIYIHIITSLLGFSLRIERYILQSLNKFYSSNIQIAMI